MASGPADLRGVVAAALMAATTLSICGNANAAEGAFEVDDADVASPGSCKVESWASFGGNGDFIGTTNPACGVNLYRDFEVGAEWVRARSNGEWTTGVAPKVKTNLIPTAIGSWGVALQAAVAYDFTARQTAAYAVTVPATLRLSNVVRINVNVGWLFERSVDQHYFTYGAGVDWRAPDGVWTFTAEIFGLAGVTEERTAVQPRFQAGIRYRPIKPFSIDLVYGRNITGENANWITLATIYQFPPPGGQKSSDPD